MFVTAKNATAKNSFFVHNAFCFLHNDKSKSFSFSYVTYFIVSLHIHETTYNFLPRFQDYM